MKKARSEQQAPKQCKCKNIICRSAEEEKDAVCKLFSQSTQVTERGEGLGEGGDTRGDTKSCLGGEVSG